MDEDDKQAILEIGNGLRALTEQVKRIADQLESWDDGYARLDVRTYTRSDY